MSTMLDYNTLDLVKLRSYGIVEQARRESSVGVIIAITLTHGFNYVSEDTALGLSSYGILSTPLRAPVRLRTCRSDEILTHELTLWLFFRACWTPIQVLVVPNFIAEECTIHLGMGWMREVEATFDFKTMNFSFKCGTGRVHTVELGEPKPDQWLTLADRSAHEPGGENCYTVDEEKGDTQMRPRIVRRLHRSSGIVADGSLRSVA